MIQTTAAGRRIWRMPLALAALGATLLVLPSGPAEADTTFTVNKTGNAGDRRSDGVCDSKSKNGIQCTLRAAIEEANETDGVDTIEFDIGDTSSLKTIAPTRPLPTITEAVTIDGYTQSGASENTLDEGNDAVLKVQLKGGDAGSANGLSIIAQDTTVRGLVINRFEGSGVFIGGSGATGNRIEGNFIGTDADGTTDRGNDSDGVDISGADANTIGGTQPDQRNVISGNGADGVEIFGSDATDNAIEGNFIGTMADGTGDLGNVNAGVFIFAADNTVGGLPGSGAGNRIAHNGGEGVIVWEISDTGNSILSNSIFQNADLGINLRGGSNVDSFGVTANDEDDPDTGANNLQNFPEITSATRDISENVTTIPGTLNSNPGQSFTIQCFLAGGGDPSGHGEGSVLLDTRTVSDNDDDGDVSFTCESSNPALGLVQDPKVSATATNTVTGDTSEFSQNVTVNSVP